MRVYSIDLLRFLAAISVVLYHYFFRTPDLLDDSSLNNIIGPYVKYGYLGVDVFFIISGFVIFMSLKGRNSRDFFKSRVLRLTPSYTLAVILTFPVIYYAGPNIFGVEIRDFLINLTSINLTPLNIFFNARHVDEPYWTLAVEIIFYILVWFILFFKGIDRYKIFLTLWLAASIMNSLFLNSHVHMILKYLLITHYAGYFIAGAVFFDIYKNGKIKLWHGLMIALSLFISIKNALDRSLEFSLQIGEHFNPYFIAAVIISAYLYFYLLSTKRTGKFEWPIWAKLGSLTYPLYLIHDGIGRTIIYYTQSAFGAVLSMTIACAVTLALSFFIVKIWEKPATSSLRKIIGYKNYKTQMTQDEKKS